MATPAVAISRSIRNYTLLYIGHTSLSIIHTIRLAALYQMYGMVCSLLLYGSLFTPHVVLPKWGNRSTFAPRKANRASQSMWLTAISPHRNASLSLLGIPHILVAINKMDLVDFSKDVYDKIVADYKKM